jgi:putative ubiquitin-RnfH superfamily antitoxin RatB of RatAB toxin-antitoxin module
MVNYPMVTSNLIYNTLVQLDKGNETGVFGALKKLNSELTSHKGTPIEIYRKIVKDAVTSMEK